MARAVDRSSPTRTRLLSPEQARAERARLEEELKRIEAQDAERYAIIGRIVTRQAEHDETFAKQLRALLDRHVTDRGERMCVGLTTARRSGRRRAIAEPSAPISSGAEPAAMPEQLP